MVQEVPALTKYPREVVADFLKTARAQANQATNNAILKVPDGLLNSQVQISAAEQFPCLSGVKPGIFVQQCLQTVNFLTGQVTLNLYGRIYFDKRTVKLQLI